MKVGIANNAYPEKRCITCITDNTFVNFKKRNIYHYLNYAEAGLGKTQPDFIFRSILPVSQKQIDVFHFFNHIPYTRINWVVSFETAVPRIRQNITFHRIEDGRPLPGPDDKTARLIKLLAQKNCPGLIAISQCARDIQLGVLSGYPHYQEQIKAKLHVIHPPQVLLLEEKKKRHDEKVNFIFVGKEFYRKGGAEIILAFQQLFAEGAISQQQVSLTLIGDMDTQFNYLHGAWQDDADFYAGLKSSLAEMRCARHYSAVPNAQVIEMLKRSDVGLLPTWGDTYGYSVLEMQACGCPVISTNVRALPEINPDEAGWRINLRLNRFGELLIKTYADKQQARSTIVDGLKSSIVAAVKGSDTLAEKAAGSISRIKAQHDPERYKIKIGEIYGQSA